MVTVAADQLTTLLHRWAGGDTEAVSELMPLTYEYLRRIAQNLMASERDGHTLEATELVHQAYVRLSDGRNREWNDRKHFYAVCALVMRRLLVDHARKNSRRQRLLVDQAALEAAGLNRSRRGESERVLALDAALEELAQLDVRKARIVQLRFFAGLTLDQVAEVLDVSQATVVRDWRFSRAWLENALRDP